MSRSIIILLALTLVAAPAIAQFYTPKMVEEQKKRDEAVRRIQEEEAKEAARKKAQEEADQKRKLEIDQRVQQEILRAREGKATVLGFSETRVGLQSLTTARVFLDGVERLMVVPNIQNRDGTWTVDNQLVAELRKLAAGQYETVHSEQFMGLEFVVGVGDSSPKTLQQWAAARTQKLAIFETTGSRFSRSSSGSSTSSTGSSTSATSGSTAGETSAASGSATETTEDTGGVAVGRFLKLADGMLDGKACKVITIQRGLAMINTDFYLAEQSGRTLRPASRDVIAKAEALTEGQSLRVTYEVINGRNIAKSFATE